MLVTKRISGPSVQRLLFLSLLLVVVILTVSAPLLARPASKEESMQQKAQMTLKVAREQMDRELYDEAGETLGTLKNEMYGYLSGDEQKQVDQMLAKVSRIDVDKADISRIMAQSDEMAAQGDFASAISLLESIQDSEALSDRQQGQVDAAIAEFSRRLEEQGEAVVIEVVESDAPQEAVEIEDEDVEVILIEQAKPQEMPMASEASNDSQEAADNTQARREGDYIRTIEMRRNRQINYTKAVVNDALNKARGFMNENEFDAAKQALARAFSVVNKNKLLLGDELYTQYHSQLTSLSEEILAAQKKYIDELEKERRRQTQQIQEEIRQTMTAQRQQAVKEFMARAKAFVRQQRYEESLGQLEQLLVLDPLNNDALLLKQTLEDTVRWRKQVEIQKETDREEMKVLLDADRRSIPFANEVTFAKNWKELVARRDSDFFGGVLNPADELVMEQLDKQVDLSMLTEDTTLEEAIDLIRNSIDPALPIIVNWKDLSQNGFIEKDEPIGMSGEGLSNVRLGTALERLLQSVGGGLVELSYVVQDGIVTVATSEFLPERYIQKVYNVTEVIHSPVDFEMERQDINAGVQGGTGGGGGGGGRSSGSQSGSSSSSSSRSSGRSSGGGRSGGGTRGGTNLQTTELGTPTITGSELAEDRAIELAEIIIETIEPDSWFDAGGEGSIQIFGSRYLIVWQTPEVHKQIDEFLKTLIKMTGDQISIEARFLLVDENYLEDIGIQMDFNPSFSPFGGVNFDQSFSTQGTFNSTRVGSTSVSSSLGGTAAGNPALEVDFGGQLLDELAVDFMVRATKMHGNSRSLTAPKVTVLSGESAVIGVEKERNFIANAEISSEALNLGDGAADNVFVTTVNRTIGLLTTGIVLNVTPTVTYDRKYVILRISTYFVEELASGLQTFNSGFISGQIEQIEFELPELQYTTVETRVLVPDRGTVLLGGQTLTAEREIESGVPVLSKLPLVGRLFTNRSEIKDKQVLLILIQPTLLLKDETERDAVAAMEAGGFQF